MWRKKSENKILQEKQQLKDKQNSEKLEKTLIGGLWVFIIVFILEVIVSITVGVDFFLELPIPHQVLRITELPEYYQEFLIDAAFTAILFMLLRFFSPYLFEATPDTMMCDKCFKTKNFDKEMNCSCGGHYLQIDNFEWIESEKKPLLNDMSWIEKYSINKNEG